MTLHQEVAASASSPSRSETFRLKALLSEQRARESIDRRSKHDWEELAVEWHMMANWAVSANSEISQLKLSEMTTPEPMLIKRSGRDPWIKAFMRRLSVLLDDLGRKKPS
jgi:hypothetical protein